MTEQETPANEVEEISPAPSEAADDEAVETPSASDKPSRAPWMVLFILFLAACGAAYYWMTAIYAPYVSETAQRLDAIEQKNRELGGALDSSAQEIAASASKNAQLSERLGAITNSQADLSESVKALYAKESQTNLDWVLAEVEYLVFAASQRLALEQDAATASAALKAADHRLASAQHPDLLDLREQLARDIAELDAVKLPDIEGLAIYLANAATRVEKLPTRPIAELDMPLSTTSEVIGEERDWSAIARAVWSDVKSLVEIKDGELEDGVLFDPKLRYFLQQNLRLELASARLSVMQRDNANFRAAVTLINDLLNMYYDTSNGAVSELMTRLNADKAIELSPPVPGISGSLDAVRAKRAAIRDAALAGR